MCGALTGLLRVLARLLPAGRREWAEAVQAEASQAPAGWPRLGWLAGGGVAGSPLVAAGGAAFGAMTVADRQRRGSPARSRMAGLFVSRS